MKVKRFFLNEKIVSFSYKRLNETDSFTKRKEGITSFSSFLKSENLAR